MCIHSTLDYTLNGSYALEQHNFHYSYDNNDADVGPLLMMMWR